MTSVNLTLPCGCEITADWLRGDRLIECRHRTWKVTARPTIAYDIEESP